jgi:hypothetical protein
VNEIYLPISDIDNPVQSRQNKEQYGKSNCFQRIRKKTVSEVFLNEPKSEKRNYII